MGAWCLYDDLIGTARPLAQCGADVLHFLFQAAALCSKRRRTLEIMEKDGISLPSTQSFSTLVSIDADLRPTQKVIKRRRPTNSTLPAFRWMKAPSS